MEREGREVRGRRGGEMRKGIIVGGMVLGLLLGCNNGEIEKLEKKSSFYESVANLGKGFLSVFTDLGDMVTEALGIKSETKKDDIGKYFTAIETTMKKVKERLNTLVGENGNYAKVKEKVTAFITTIDKIAEGAKEVSEVAKGGTEPLGNMADNAAGGAVNVGEVDKLIKGIKTIVEAVELKEGSHEAGTDKKAEDGGTARNNGGDEAGNLFANNQAGAAAGNAKKSATDAAKAIGAVSGADILKAMVQVGGKAATLAKNNSQAAGSVNAVNGAKDAVVAGAVALRAMAKGGKFAGQSGAEDAVKIVKDAAASAVNKTLSTLIIAIRRTVDSGLKTINEALAAINQGDMLPETGEAGATKVSK